MNGTNGKKNVHWKGKYEAMRCTQSGMRVMGTKRPDRIISRAKKSSKMALTRVVQNVINPRTA